MKRSNCIHNFIIITHQGSNNNSFKQYLTSLATSQPKVKACLTFASTADVLGYCYFIYYVFWIMKKYGKEKYLKAVVDCSKVVWQRGLLTKGYGICHGVSGNAYSFLCAYNLTGKEKYLHRALQVRHSDAFRDKFCSWD